MQIATKPKLIIATILTVLGIVAPMLMNVSSAHATTFPAGHLIDNYVLRNTSTMDQPAIQAFLNGKNSGLTNYRDVENCGSSSGAHYTFYTSHYACGSYALASQIIYDAAQAYGINPQVILATLQKEQSLVTTPNPTQSQLDCAMGYNSCGGYVGFFEQVDNGTWQLRTYYELGSGNNWWGFTPASYPCKNATGLYTPGLLPGNDVTFSDDEGHPYTHVVIENIATAGLYCYTPYVYSGSATHYYSGSQNFEQAFTNWGWSLYSNNCVFQDPTAVISDVNFRRLRTNIATANFLIYTGSGTNCIESHAWNIGFNSWQTHTPTNLPVVSPVNGVVKFADLTPNGIDQPVYIGINGGFAAGTQSGYAEFHVWNSSMNNWLVHAISNLPICDPAHSASNPASCSTSTNPSAQNSSIDFANLSGDGIDRPMAIQYKNTASGFVEFWIWSPGLQSWAQHIITNLASPLDPTNMQIGFGDLYGSGADEAIAIGVGGTSSGNIEFHVWAPGEQVWDQHIVSNLPTASATGCSVDFAKFIGTQQAYGVAVCKSGTASGNIEFHVWNPGLNTWQGHYISNQKILN